jgi:hypothetical protein
LILTYYLVLIVITNKISTKKKVIRNKIIKD